MAVKLVLLGVALEQLSLRQEIVVGFHLVVHVHLVLVLDEFSLAMPRTILLIKGLGHVRGHPDEVLVGARLLLVLLKLADLLAFLAAWLHRTLLKLLLLLLLLLETLRFLVSARHLSSLYLKLVYFLLLQLLLLESLVLLLNLA